LAEIGRQAEVIILCVPDSSSVEDVLASGTGLVGELRPDAIIVDCSTSHPNATRCLASRLARKGVGLIDAPLTGSRAQAEDGTLNVLGGGAPETFERARPALRGFAARVFYLGPTGAGHTAKLINNFLGLLALTGLCEA
jgi:3-hydroxyisobutyrate dehydrogenase-like beta-hydroxyacid dehydrogenase